MKNKETVLITGASGGIGLELAKVFAAHDCDLILVARTKERLEVARHELMEKFQCSVRVFDFDLTFSNAPKKLYDALELDNIAIDVLVNNAGFADYGLFDQASLKKQLEMIDLNVRALVELTGLFLPGMLERKHGKVLNVASTAAFQPGPLMAVYYATKAFVLSFSEAIRSEVKGRGVFVTALCPGPTKTNFADNSALQQSRLLRGFPLMSAESVAKMAYFALMKNTAVVVPGMLNKFLAFLARVVPRSVATFFSRRALERI